MTLLIIKTYKTEFTAKGIAAKKTKKTGQKHIVVPVEGGWEVHLKKEHEAMLKDTTTTLKIPPACWKAIKPIVESNGVKDVALVLVGKHIDLMLNGEKVWWFLDAGLANATLVTLQGKMIEG